jgi:hypothetical protein
MNLPARQQLVLDQIEQILQAADPRLKSMFATFARMASREAMPASEAISGRPARRTVLISVIVISVLSAVTVSIAVTSKACPGLSPGQAAASAAVRFAACGKNMDLWSRGGR